MGGNVFSGLAKSISVELIEPTLKNYFDELSRIFPKKSKIFNLNSFFTLGSVGKKPVSGDIDLGINMNDIIDFNNVEQSVTDWGLNLDEFKATVEKYRKRARTATEQNLHSKAMFFLVSKFINNNSSTIRCAEGKAGPTGLFCLFPQYNSTSQLSDLVQIDWMAGEPDWLKFSYYSGVEPHVSNIKGLHRTQLMIAAFRVAGLQFSHALGVKDKETGQWLSSNPADSLKVLGERLGFEVPRDKTESYYDLYCLFIENMNPLQYEQLISSFFKVLDSTRADIPENLTYTWLNYKDGLGLTGKFLPDNSKLKEFL